VEEWVGISQHLNNQATTELNKRLLSENPNLPIELQEELKNPNYVEMYEPTLKEQLGTAGMAALEITTSGIGGSQANAIKNAVVSVAKSKGKSKAIQMVKLMAESGTIGAGFGATDAMKQNLSGEEIAESAAGGFVVGAALPPVISGVAGVGAKFLNKIKKGKTLSNKDLKVFRKETDKKGMTQKIADNVSTSMNKIDPTKQVTFQRMTGKTSGEWLNSRGHTGTRRENVKTLVTSWKKSLGMVDKALSESNAVVKGQILDDVIEDVTKRANSVADKKLIKQITSLKNELQNTGTLKLKRANDLKRLYERHVRIATKGDLVAGSAAKTRAKNIDDELREFIIDAAENAGIKDIRTLNKETQAARFLADEIAGKSVKQAANNTMGLTDNILFASGAISPDPLTLGFLGAKKLTSSERAQSLLIKAFSKKTSTLAKPNSKIIRQSNMRTDIKNAQKKKTQKRDKKALLAEKQSPTQKPEQSIKSSEKDVNSSSPKIIPKKKVKVKKSFDNVSYQKRLTTESDLSYKAEKAKWKKEVGTRFPLTKENFVNQYSKKIDLEDIDGSIERINKTFSRNIDDKIKNNKKAIMDKIEKKADRDSFFDNINQEIDATSEKSGIINLARKGGFKGNSSEKAFDFIENRDVTSFGEAFDSITYELGIDDNEALERIKDAYLKKQSMANPIKVVKAKKDLPKPTKSASIDGMETSK